MLALLATLAVATVSASPPNFLFLLVDDAGFGDMDMCHTDLTNEQCNVVPPGNEQKRNSGYLNTPRIKQLAKEGQIMNNWYSPRAICTPSRVATLSGRDPVYFGGVGEFLRIYPSNPSRGGYPHSEKSVAEYLKESNYVTGYSGKWHMGLTNGTEHPYAYAPINHGFDEVDQWIAGSNGEPCAACNMNLPGDENIYHMCTFSQIVSFDSVTHEGTIIEQPIRWENITSRLLKAPLAFLDRHAGDTAPFFYQHAFTKTHVPWVPSRFFVSSDQGIWTDTVGEVDWAVGVLVDKLKAIGKYSNTMIVLTSDNGPYKEFASTFVPQNCKFSGCDEGPEKDPGDGGVPIPDLCKLATDFDQVSTAGRFAGGKGNTFEGGMRMPTIVSWPAKMPGGLINNVVSSSMDFLPTAVAAAGGVLDNSITLDGRNILPFLENPAAWDSVPQGKFVYWCGIGINAVRIDRHKIIFFTQTFTAGMTNDSPVTPADRCDGGTCCDGSPGRLCTCVVGEMHPVPIVIDLDANSMEDMTLQLDPTTEETKAIVAAGQAFRRERYESVLDTLAETYPGATYNNETTAKGFTKTLAGLPNSVQIDACIFLGSTVPSLGDPDREICGLEAGDKVGCPYVPEQCQIPEFVPYENCGIDGMGPACQIRRPCCDGGPDYKGPWEYQNPAALNDPSNNKFQKCGCFKQPQGDSYFPPELLPSVCEWQQLVNKENDWCSPDVCDTDGGLSCTDENLRNYGLFNEAYPDSQTHDSCDGKCDEDTECIEGVCQCVDAPPPHACCSSLLKSCGESNLYSECLCDFDDYCCTFDWDVQCKQEAIQGCGLKCPEYAMGFI